MPWQRSQGPAQSIRVWNDKLGDYEEFRRYDSFGGNSYSPTSKSKSEQEARARSVAKYLKSEGHKVRVKRWSNTIGDFYFVVYWFENRKVKAE